jgi:hypothetical protein
MVRSEKNAGYLFFSNYQRYVENKDLENIQVQVKLDDVTVTIPSKPITIPKNAFGIWPINLNMNGAVLEYATAQLFARFPGKEGDTYFFFAHHGIAPELSFRANTINGINVGKNPVSKSSGQISVIVNNPGIANILEVKSVTGQKIRICVLPYELALRTTRLDFRGAPHLVITDGANAISNNEGLDLLSTGAATGVLWIYPSPASLQMTGKTIKGKDEGNFRKFEWSVPQKDISVALKQVSKGDTSKYEVSIPSDALEDVYDVQIDIDHTCNYLTAKLDDHLIGDWYYIGMHYRPSILHWGKQVLGKTISFELTPLTAQTPCFIEEAYRPDFTLKPSYAEINEVKAIPVYRVSFN